MQCGRHFEREHYVVTGVDMRGRRFRRSFEGLHWALGINVWHGSVWAECMDTGKRRLLVRYFN